MSDRARNSMKVRSSLYFESDIGVSVNDPANFAATVIQGSC